MGKNGGFSTDSGKGYLWKYLVSAMVLLCMVTNCIVPRFAVGSIDPDLFSKILKSQTALFEYFSFSALPLDIVNSLLSKNAPINSTDEATPVQKKTDSKGTSHEFVFISVQLQTTLVKPLAQKSVNLVVSSVSGVSQAYLLLKDSLDPPRHGSQGFYLLFLLCFFMLPRSSVNDAYAVIVKRIAHTTRFECSNRVFHLSRGLTLPAKRDWPIRLRGLAFPALLANILRPDPPHAFLRGLSCLVDSVIGSDPENHGDYYETH